MKKRRTIVPVLTLNMQVNVVEVRLVVLGVDLALVDALVVMLDVVNDQVPLVVSTNCLHRHSPVSHKR